MNKYTLKKPIECEGELTCDKCNRWVQGDCGGYWCKSDIGLRMEVKRFIDRKTKPNCCPLTKVNKTVDDIKEWLENNYDGEDPFCDYCHDEGLRHLKNFINKEEE